MQSKVIKCVHDLFENVCLELFNSLNCDVTSCDYFEIDIKHTPIAKIDAGSDEIALVVGLQLPMSVLALTYPVKKSIPLFSDVDLEDWISELSNRLIGRLKNKLLAHNCVLGVGLPTSFFNSKLTDVLLTSNEIKSYYFDIDGEKCACHIILERFDNVEHFIFETPGEDNMQAEGDMELF